MLSFYKVEDPLSLKECTKSRPAFLTHIRYLNISSQSNMISCKFIQRVLRLLGNSEIQSTSVPQIPHPHLNEMPQNQPQEDRGHESATAAHSPLHKLKTRTPQIRKQRTSRWQIPQNNLRDVRMDAWDELVVDPDENLAQRQSILHSITRAKLRGKARNGNRRE